MHGYSFKTAKLSKEASRSVVPRNATRHLSGSKLSRGHSQPPTRIAAETAQRVKDETTGAFDERSFAQAKQSLLEQETAASPSATEPQAPKIEANIPEEAIGDQTAAGANDPAQAQTNSEANIVCDSRRRGPIKDFPYREGDFVLGKVIWEDPNVRMGWRIELCANPDILGLMPCSFKPYTLKDSLEDFYLCQGAVGTVRMFQIEKIPPNMQYHGKGPILSARGWDFHVIWRRAEQIRLLHEEKTDTIAVSMRSSNVAGLLGVWDGIPLFVPWKFAVTYTSRLDDTTKNAALERRMSEGKSYVRIVDVDAHKNRFVGSLVDADQIRSLQDCQLGDLMEGFVVSVKDYGVFLRMGRHHAIKGLLHVRNVSQARVTDLSKYFKEGQEIKAYLLDVDEKNQVEYSTMELESYPGEMLDNQGAAMARANNLGNFWAIHDDIRGQKQRQERDKRTRQEAEASAFRPAGYRPGSMDNGEVDW